MPNFQLWIEEDGTAHGPYGKKRMRCSSKTSKALTMWATDDAGQGFTVSVAQMVARAWLPPRPPNAKLVHLDGDLQNNAASNLAWVAKVSCAEKHRRYCARSLPKLQADPDDPRHGTRTGYAIGCRCRACRNAAMVHRRILITEKTIREAEALCQITTTSWPC